MTANRPYREAQSIQYALHELRSNAGTQFDATAVVAVEACLAAGLTHDRRQPVLAFA